MNVTKLVPEGVRIELTDDEAKDLIWTLWNESTENHAAQLHDAILNATYSEETS